MKTLQDYFCCFSSSFLLTLFFSWKPFVLHSFHWLCSWFRVLYVDVFNDFLCRTFLFKVRIRWRSFNDDFQGRRRLRKECGWRRKNCLVHFFKTLYVAQRDRLWWVLSLKRNSIREKKVVKGAWFFHHEKGGHEREGVTEVSLSRYWSRLLSWTHLFFSCEGSREKKRVQMIPKGDRREEDTAWKEGRFSCKKIRTDTENRVLTS